MFTDERIQLQIGRLPRPQWVGVFVSLYFRASAPTPTQPPGIVGHSLSGRPSALSCVELP